MDPPFRAYTDADCELFGSPWLWSTVGVACSLVCPTNYSPALAAFCGTFYPRTCPLQSAKLLMPALNQMPAREAGLVWMQVETQASSCYGMQKFDHWRGLPCCLRGSQAEQAPRPPKRQSLSEALFVQEPLTMYCLHTATWPRGNSLR